MVKRHLKTHASPSSWPINRKKTKFVVKPRPGAHSLEMGISITTALKHLEFCETAREVKTALNSTEVLVNGRRVKDHKFMVGYMDVLAVPEKKLFFRVVLNEKGKLNVIPIPEKEASLLPCKVDSKSLVKGGTIKYNCHNGYNLKYSGEGCGKFDTLVLNIDTRKIEGHIPLKEGSFVTFTGGGLVGKSGVFVKREGKIGIVKLDGEQRTTAIRYVFVLGTKNPVIKTR